MKSLSNVGIIDAVRAYQSAQDARRNAWDAVDLNLSSIELGTRLKAYEHAVRQEEHAYHSMTKLINIVN